jgi:hypothetical protein
MSEKPFAEQYLELKYEDGGYRHYLGGEPIHAGTQLRLYLNDAVPVLMREVGGKWVWARYESRDGGKASLYLAGDRVLDLKPDMRLRWPESWER